MLRYALIRTNSYSSAGTLLSLYSSSLNLLPIASTSSSICLSIIFPIRLLHFTIDSLIVYLRWLESTRRMPERNITLWFI